MQVCMLSRSTIYHEVYGGMEHVAHELAEELSNIGVQVTMLTTSLTNGQDQVIEVKEHPYKIISLPHTTPASYSEAWWNKSLAYFKEINNKNKFDIVFSVSAAANGLLKVKEDLKIPFVFQAHGTSLGEIKSKLQLSFKKKLSSLKNVMGYIKDLKTIPKYDMVITIGEKVYKDYLNEPIKMNQRIEIVANAVNTEKFYKNDQLGEKVRSSYQIPNDAHVFISASRLHAQKGIQQSLEIFNTIQNSIPNSYFIIAGDGPEKGSLEKRVKDLQLTEKVKMVGSVDRDQLNQYYSAADYMLFPTLRQEGLPLTILEALSSSVICFVSDNLVFDKDLSIMPIKPHDIRESSEIVKEFLTNGNIKEKKLECRQIIEQKYSMHDWAMKYRKLFEDLSVSL